MGKYWLKPIYILKTFLNDEILIDVTTSVSSGLPPKETVSNLIDFFKSNGVDKILDFGAGALRHCFPLLDAGFQVCAVEYQEQFRTHKCAENLIKAREYPNFSTLIYPKDFKRDTRKFDAALLMYVLQTMPIPKERDILLKLLYKKLNRSAFVLYASRYNQVKDLGDDRRVSDGYFMSVKNELKSFYKEFSNEDTLALFNGIKFRRIKSLSERGTEQVFLFSKGGATWI